MRKNSMQSLGVAVLMLGAAAHADEAQDQTPDWARGSGPDQLSPEDRQKRAERRAREACSRDNAIEELQDGGDATIGGRYADDDQAAIAAVEKKFAECYDGRVAQCQREIDGGDLTKGKACWNQWPWLQTKIRHERRRGCVSECDDFYEPGWSREDVSACLDGVARQEQTLATCVAMSDKSDADAEAKLQCLSKYRQALAVSCGPLDLRTYIHGYQSAADLDASEAKLDARIAPKRCDDALGDAKKALAASDVTQAKAAVERARRYCRSAAEKKKLANAEKAVAKLQKKLEELAARCGPDSVNMFVTYLQLGSLDPDEARGCEYTRIHAVVMGKTRDGYYLLNLGDDHSPVLAALKAKKKLVRGSRLLGGTSMTFVGVTDFERTDGAMESLPVFRMSGR